jgi:hypothetical protein
MHHAAGRPPGPHLVESILASLSQGGVWGLAGSQRCHEACRVHACAAAAAGGHLQSPIAALQRQQDIWYVTRADALFFQLLLCLLRRRRRRAVAGLQRISC